MAGTKHIINKVAVNTSGIATETAFKWRARLASYLSDDFPVQLQYLLDELYRPEEQVRINRLDINIDLPKTEAIDVFQKALIQELRRALTHQKREPVMRLRDDSPDVAAAEDRSVDAWLFYIRNGYYPWFHQQALTAKELELLFEAYGPIMVRQLPDILKSLQAQQRFLINITEQVLLLLLPYYVSTEIRKNIFGNSLKIDLGRKGRLAKAGQVLLKAIANKGEVDERQFIEMMDGTIEPDQNAWQEKQAEPVAKNGRPKTERPANLEEEKDTAIWIQNAGVVLIHPFLPVLFNRLSVANEQNQIVDISKALGLIHYLLYAEDEYSDALMVLPKILCGLSYNDPVPMEFSINNDERKECDELLLSVIEYWDVLKNTSAKGLLEAFVLRKGKLTSVDSGWLLQVERQTPDILLDRLPWNIGYIKLPWMATLLTTQWG